MASSEVVCITGIAGFIGSHLALHLSRLGHTVIGIDNFSRRGSHLNLERLQSARVKVLHGDTRHADDLEALPRFDLVIACAADPAVSSGTHGNPASSLRTNLVGTMNCLEAARKRGAAVLFFSTTRVIPLAILNGPVVSEEESRFEWVTAQTLTGWSQHGFNEHAPLHGERSLYGTAKLAGEHLLCEYAHSYGVPCLCNRCGVVAGPWQMGHAEQGFVSYWVLSHVLGYPLEYRGFGGTGKQVRDILHVSDLCDLVTQQVHHMESWSGETLCVGGGNDNSASLVELTSLCQEATGNHVAISRLSDTSSLDTRIIISDSSAVRQRFSWAPTRNLTSLIGDLRDWGTAHKSVLQQLFVG